MRMSTSAKPITVPTPHVYYNENSHQSGYNHSPFLTTILWSDPGCVQQHIRMCQSLDGPPGQPSTCLCWKSQTRPLGTGTKLTVPEMSEA